MQRQVGLHSIEIVDDLVIATSRGNWSMEEIVQLTATWDSVLAAHGTLYYIGDFTQGMQLSSAVRRHVVKWAMSHQATAVALIINSLPVRALAMLVVRAALLLRQTESEPTFCSSMAEAKAHIASERQRIAREVEATTSAKS